MKAHLLATLGLAGWFMVVAPMPSAVGQFDVRAPISEWNVRSAMFRSDRECEAYRDIAATSGLHRNLKPYQFISDDAAAGAPRIPKSASRCLDAGANSVDLHG